jgi:deoxyribodipyrimidine photo-lyase
MKAPVVLFWFRRDLRLEDNRGLFEALKSGHAVQPVFIFDTHILNDLEDRNDRRVQFIHEALLQMQQRITSVGASLDIRIGDPLSVFSQLTTDYSVRAVYTNHDYEPYARERDQLVQNFLAESGIEFLTFKDQVIFEKAEVVKENGTPYTVFTPYSRRWKATLQKKDWTDYQSHQLLNQLNKTLPIPIPSLKKIGFTESGITFPASTWNKELISGYQAKRDIPGVRGTSQLGVHLRFGTISIRKLARETSAWSETFLNELIWRDFYHMILWHFPHVVGKAFKPAYDAIKWRNKETEFEAWCEGQTGYPIVDAGMRELNTTGYMHNRVRMIVASFLTKHLLVDWRWGEAYFAKKLLDFDLAANNGGWQWAAGSGCDAAPYFRVFNPYLQTQKFDPQLTYIRKWVPEFEELTYVRPIVQHEVARKRCLEVYGNALKPSR